MEQVFYLKHYCLYLLGLDFEWTSQVTTQLTENNFKNIEKNILLEG